MLHALLQELSPQKVGLHNNYNDKHMAKTTTSTYQPPSYHDYPRALPPTIIIRESPSFWDYYFMSRLLGQPSTTVYVNAPSSRETKKNPKNDEATSLIGAVIVFGLVLAVAGIGLAYGLREMPKILENLAANRKVGTNSIKLVSGGFLGLSGLVGGLSLGAFYGPALLGAAGAVAGPAVAGGLLALAGASAGLFVGKYFAKLCHTIYTRGKATDSDSFTLSPRAEQAIAKQFRFPSGYIGSRANLMYGYIVNKMEIAKKNNAKPDWLKTLEGYRKALKKGEFSPELKQYFDNELILLRAEWFEKRKLLADPRYRDDEFIQIDCDLKALGVINSQEQQLQTYLQGEIPSAPPIQEPSVGYYPSFEAPAPTVPASYSEQYKMQTGFQNR